MFWLFCVVVVVIGCGSRYYSRYGTYVVIVYGGGGCGYRDGMW